MNEKEAAIDERRFFADAKKLPLAASLIGRMDCSSRHYIRRRKSPIAFVGYILDGEGYIVKDGIAHLAAKDMIFFCHADEPHQYYTSPQKPWKLIWMYLSGNLTEEIAERYGIAEHFLFDGNGLKYIFERIAGLINNSNVTNFECQKIISSLYLELVMELSNRIPEKAHTSEAVLLKKHLDLNTNRLVSNEELSGIIFHSPDYCIKLFKKEYGKTPYDYQLNQKMSIACQMLRQTDMTVIEIAASLGYNDAHYFSGLFKRKCGRSPKDYRQKNR